MDFRYYVVDETRHWLDPDLIRRSGGTIYGVYVFDADIAVHCCELTPSFELTFLRSEPKSVPDDDDDRERLEDQIREADRDSSPVIYVWTHHIAVEKCQKVSYQPDSEADQETALESALEYCQGNWNVRLPQE